MRLSKEKLLDLFFQMLRIHRMQRKIERQYHLDEMKTPIHLCIGQEAIAVGVCAHLRRDDYISSNHRSHGHYLAKGGDLRALIAELHCRDTGCSRGRGGSMHLVDTAVGHFGSSSIVGGGIPIATGLGLSIQMQGQDRVSVVFFGDGAADEGVLYESINFAILKKLPVIFVLENNEYSVCSHVSARQAGKVLFHYLPQDYLPNVLVDGNSVIEVYGAAQTAVARARRGGGPSFLECKTYRVRGHAGSWSDEKLGYRSAEEIRAWEARCPVTTFQQQLLKEGLMTDKEIERMTVAIDIEIDEALQFAYESPLPRGEDLHRYLFRE
jgi:acetoin:2,6-dichlorophenolindophenol oxidoreductase subunit alpha